MHNLVPDRGQIEIFVEASLRHATSGHYLSLRSFFEDRNEPLQIVPAQINGNLIDIINLTERMAGQAANNVRPVVFCPPIASFHNARSAEEKDIAEGFALSVECDARPQRARKQLESLLGPATLIVRSGGRWRDPENGELVDKLHLHWRLAKPVKDKAAIEKLKRARELVARLAGADTTGAPVSHCYRWPGSWHRKAEPRLCEIETVDPDREIDLNHAFDILEKATKAAGGPSEERANTKDNEPPAADRPRLDWRDNFEKILSGGEFHPSLAPLASSFAARGVPRAVAEEILRSLLLNATTADPERLRRRDIELGKLPETVSSAFKKFKREPLNAAADFAQCNEALMTLVNWLWSNHLARGKITMLVGDSALGKSQVSISWAAILSKGGVWPDGDEAPKGSIIFLSAEDGMGDTIVPRLIAARADLNKIF
jgi:hypothetical protein